MEVQTKDKNKQLMLAMGSKTGRSDPEPPDQWLWVMRHGECATDRAMAWIKSKTTAYRHDSPYCVDEHGKALHVQDMAMELDWQLQTARNVLSKLIKQNRARVDEEDGTIWQCANIPAAHQQPVDGCIKEDSSYSVQSWILGYLVDSVRSLSSEQKAELEASYKAYLDWKDRLFADGMAALRALAENYEDRLFSEYGIKKRRLAKQSRETPPQVQLSLLREPLFDQARRTKEEHHNGNENPVHSFSDSVQTEKQPCTDPENGVYKVDLAPVSLLTQTHTHTKEDPPPPIGTTLPAAAVSHLNPTEKENAQITESLEKHCQEADLRAVTQIFADCRRKAPDITAGEICSYIDSLGASAKRKDNPLAWLMTAIPNSVTVAGLTKRRANPPPLKRDGLTERERKAFELFGGGRKK